MAFREGLGEYIVSDAISPDLQAYVGRPISEIASKRGNTPIEVMLDLAVAANLEIGFTRQTARFDTRDRRELRRRVLRDPRLVLGASDGGAHVRGVVNVEYSTASFAQLVRDDDVFTVEELVQEFTDVPARLYGLTDRGRLERGAWADVVVFDPETIDTSTVALRRDLPAGAPRLYSHGVGVDTVLVGGEPVVRGGELTNARPGRLLRSGRDTHTPRRSSLLRRRRTPVPTA
jgi:N-acyl-D-aspartate/D-glutamate deacylase